MMTDRDSHRLDRKLDSLSGRLPSWLSWFFDAIRNPRARIIRIPLGILLVIGGFLGFLPVLGFWMVPLGLIFLAQDFPRLRRPIRHAIYWAERRWQKYRRGRSKP
jgi:purine-cytosine permease-like protein